MTNTVGSAIIEVAVDSRGVETGMQPANNAIAQTGRNLANLGQQGGAAFDSMSAGAGGASTRVDAAARAMIGNIQRTTATMEAGTRGTRQYFEALANQRGINVSVLRPYLDQLEAVRARQNAANDALGGAGQAMDRVGVSARQTAAALRGVPAQVTDIVTSLQGGQAPLTVFLQQGGQLRDMFGSSSAAARALGGYVVGLISPLTLAAGAAGALALAYYQGSKEGSAFSKSLIMTGNSAGATVGQLSAMARSIGEVVGTQGAAAEAVAALAGSGRVAASNMEYLGLATVKAQRSLGLSVADTVTAFEDLGKSPAEAIAKLNEKQNFLTSAVYAQIKALEVQGKADEAAALAQKTYADALSTRADKMDESLGYIEKAWRGVADGAKSAWDAMLGVGRKQSPEDQLAAVQAKIKEARAPQVQSGGANSDFREMRAAALRADLAALLDQEASLQRQIKAEKERAAQDAASAEQVRLRAEWDEKAEKGLSRKLAMEREITAARELGKKTAAPGEDAATTEERIAQRIKEIRKSYSDVFDKGIDAQIASIRRRGEVEETTGKRAYDQAAALRDAGLLSQQQYIERIDALDAGAFGRRKAALQEEIRLSAGKQDDGVAAAELRGKLANMEAEENNRLAKVKSDLYVLDVKAGREAAENYSKAYDIQVAQANELRKQVQEQRDANAQIGMSKEQIAELAAAKLEDAAADKERLVAGIAVTDETAPMLAQYQKQAAALRELAAAKRDGGMKESALEGKKELDKFLDPSKAESFAQTLRNAFGGVGSSIVGMTGALKDFSQRQAEIDKQRKNADKARAQGLMTEQEYVKATAALKAKDTQSTMAGYGDMASAAAGFFGEQSKGYQALMAVSKVFHAAELAMTLAELVPKGISAVLNQGTGDPYTAIPRMAAMAAIVAGLGVAIGGIGGSGGGASAADRQKAQGTGSVLGDSSAKSDSIAKALALVAENGKLELSYTAGMLASLRNIESSLSGLGSVIVRSTGITGKLPEGSAGSAAQFAASTLGMGILGGPIGLISDKLLGGLLGKLGGSIMGKVFGGKVTTQDIGLTADASTLGGILGGGLQAYQYVDSKKDGGLFRKDKNFTDKTALGGDVTDQFTKVLAGLASGVTEAGKILGLSGAEFTQQLEGFVVDIGKISLKDLKGDDIQKALEAVFSKVGDDLAKSSIGGLQEFQKVGEGYFETLARIASDYAGVDSILASIGGAFGATGIASVAARERLIELAGGISELASGTSSFARNFLTEAERLAPVEKYLTQELSAIGLAGIDTRDKFKAVVAGLVESGALATKTGAENFAKLMSLEDSFSTLMDAREKQAAERRSIEIEMLEAQGRSIEAVAMRRQDELAALQKTNPELVSFKKSLYDIQDAVAFSTKKRALEIAIKQASGDAAGATAMQRDDELAELAKVSPVLAAMQKQAYDAADALTISTKQRSLEIAYMQASGNAVAATAMQRDDEIAALAKISPVLAAMQKQAYDAADQLDLSTKRRQIEIEMMGASGNGLAATAARRQDEIDALAKTSVVLASMKKAAYEAADAQKLASDQRALEIQMMEVQGDAARALAMRREDELEALRQTQPALVGMKQAYFDAQDAAANASAKQDMYIAILQAVGDASGVLALQRKDELDTLLRTTPALAGMKRTLYAIQDAASRTDGAFAVLRKSIDAQKNKLQAGLDAQLAIIAAQRSAAQASYTAQKAVAQKFADDAAKQNTKLRSLDDGLLNALGSMRLAANAAADRVTAQLKISQTLAVARAGGKLPDMEDISDALRLVAVQDMTGFSSYEDFARDFGVTAGQVADLKDISGVQLSASDKQISLAQQQLDALTAAAEAADASYEQAAAWAQAAYDQQIAKLEEEMTAAQEQLDATKGISLAVKSVEDALREFKSAIDAQLKVNASAVVAAAGASTSAAAAVGPKNVPISASAAQALESYKALFRSQASYSRTLEEAGVYNNVFAAYANSFTSQMNSANNLSAQVQSLGVRLEKALQPIATATQQTASSSGQFAAQFDNVSGGGNILLIEAGG